MPSEEFQILKQRSLYSRLKRLFSTDVIVRNVGGKKLKVVDTDQVMYATDRNTLRDRFNRIRTSSFNQYSRDFTLSYQAARIELFRDYDCVGPDTIIPLPDGSRPTISELTEKYKDKPKERFYVYSYDHETNSIKLGKAYHPRKKAGGPRDCWKIILDNDQYVIGSAGHPFLMRNGDYKTIEELKVGDSLMPFYQMDFYGRGYRHIFNFSKKWQTEHRIVTEQFYRCPNKDEVIHHKNFNAGDNSPENLQIMNAIEHKKFHSDYSKNVIWGESNYENQLNKLKSSEGYKNRKFHHWNGERIGENNPFFGKTHSEESNKQRSSTLKEVFENRDQSGDKNPKYRDDLTIETLTDKAFEYYKEHGKLTSWGFVKKLKCDYSVLQNRLKNNNVTWKSFKNDIENKLNHKIKKIEFVGQLEVYDVTVEEYQNFAIGAGIFCHNTMDMDPILASALDIYADECVTKNELGKILTVTTDDNNIKQILENLFYDILNIEFFLWSWTRNLVKYGDFYLKLYISPEYGVYLAEPISAYNVTRVENSDINNKNYTKFQINLPEGGKIEDVENYQMAHFRLLSDSNFLPYGKSMVEGARRVWKQLSLMEDAMLIHRVIRAPEKRIFKIDVGNIPPQEVDQYIEKIINKTKKIPYIDPNTGDYNLRYNIQNLLEDFYLPVRGSDSGTSIEPLSGMEFTGIDDIEYLRNKMLAALKIPKAFLGYEEDLSGKATLASEDVRFAKTVNRIQKILVSELKKIAIVHLYAQGYTDESLVNFDLELTNPSVILETEKVKIWSDKVNLAKDMVENKLFSRKWIYNNVFKLANEDVDDQKNDIVEDAKDNYRFKQIEEDGIDPAKPFNKIKSDVESMEPSSGEVGGPPEAGITGGEAPPEESPKETPSPTEPPLSEKSKRPSQAGEHKYRKDTRFGYDPLGNRENTKISKTDPLRSASKSKSPLSLENLTGLRDYLHSHKDAKKDLLKESPSKSLLDESNIIDE